MPEELEGSRVTENWDVPGTRSWVVQFRYPSRFADEYAALEGSPLSLSYYREGDMFRTYVLRREDLGDGFHAVTYLFEPQREIIGDIE